MTKPKNFPGRKLARQSKVQGVTISPEQGRYYTKKTPKATWSVARAAQRGGKLGR